MTVVGMQRVFLGQIKVIAVLHIEFTAPHDPEPRTPFIAEFPLDLIERQRQRLIAGHMGSEDIGHQFFGRGCEQHLMVVTVGDAQQLIPVGVITPAFAPQVRRLDRGHLDGDVSGLGLFLMHDLFDPAQHFEPQRQPRIDTGAGLFDHPRLQHIAVADDLGVTGAFFEDGQEITAEAHGRSLSDQITGGVADRKEWASGQRNHTRSGANWIKHFPR